HDTRRYARSTHQRDEGGGVMAAEALARAEKEVIHRIGAEMLRCDRVLEAAGAQILENRLDEATIGGRAPAQGLRERKRARIGRGGEGRVLAPSGGIE